MGTALSASQWVGCGIRNVRPDFMAGVSATVRLMVSGLVETLRHSQGLRRIWSAHDLNSRCHNRPFATWAGRWGMADVVGTDGLFAAQGVLSAARIQHVRASVRGRQSAAGVLVSRPVSVTGVRAADVSRELAGHRDVARCEPRPSKNQGVPP